MSLSELLYSFLNVSPNHALPVYFKQLAGGDKRTQDKDIKTALRLARNLSE